MNIITYLRELFCYVMNKKVGQYESNSEVKTEKNTKIYRYSSVSDLSILGKKYESEHFIPERTDNWIPQNPLQSYYSDRIKTFQKWPKQIKQLPKDLARAGFYYTKVGDYVKCFYCGLVLCNWEKSDKVVSEHGRHCNSCKFMHMVYG